MIAAISLFLKNRWIQRYKRKRQAYQIGIIAESLKKLDQVRELTPEQKKEVEDFYYKLTGIKVPLIWHKYFYSRTGHFTKTYVPISLHHLEIVPRANNFNLLEAYHDKNLTDLLFPGENVAHTILKNMNGYYYYEGEPVSEEEAIRRCSNLDKVIIKPSQDTQGNGVQCFTVKDGKTSANGKAIADVFKEYKKDFLIQDWVRQHKDMAALNPTSVNTLRVVSYHSGMEVLIIYMVIRIGRKGSVIDNQSAGGISTMVDKTGHLTKSAFGGYTTDNVMRTDTGIDLVGYQVPSYDKVIDFVTRLHRKLPFFDIVGWDVAIQEDGEPVLIEFNNNPQLSQSAFGSGYGEYTERIIRELWPRPNTRYPVFREGDGLIIEYRKRTDSNNSKA